MPLSKRALRARQDQQRLAARQAQVATVAGGQATRQRAEQESRFLVPAAVANAREPLERLRGHKLLPDSVREQLPPLYSQDGLGADAIVYAKYFTLAGRGTWYFTEASAYVAGAEDPVALPKIDGRQVMDIIFFGFTISPSGGPWDDELGYSSFNELAECTTDLGVGGVRIPAVERDIHWTPIPLRECEGTEKLR